MRSSIHVIVVLVLVQVSFQDYYYCGGVHNKRPGDLEANNNGASNVREYQAIAEHIWDQINDDLEEEVKYQKFMKKIASNPDGFEHFQQLTFDLQAILTSIDNEETTTKDDVKKQLTACFAKFDGSIKSLHCGKGEKTEAMEILQKHFIISANRMILLKKDGANTVLEYLRKKRLEANKGKDKNLQKVAQATWESPPTPVGYTLDKIDEELENVGHYQRFMKNIELQPKGSEYIEQLHGDFETILKSVDMTTTKEKLKKHFDSTREKFCGKIANMKYEEKEKTKAMKSLEDQFISSALKMTSLKAFKKQSANTPRDDDNVDNKIPIKGKDAKEHENLKKEARPTLESPPTTFKQTWDTINGELEKHKQYQQFMQKIESQPNGFEYFKQLGSGLQAILRSADMNTTEDKLKKDFNSARDKFSSNIANLSYDKTEKTKALKTLEDQFISGAVKMITLKANAQKKQSANTTQVSGTISKTTKGKGRKM